VSLSHWSDHQSTAEENYLSNLTTTMPSILPPSTTAIALALLVCVFSASVRAASVYTPPPFYKLYDTRCVPSTSVFKDENKDHICRKLFPGFTDITIPNPLTAGYTGNDSVLIEAALNSFMHYNMVFQKDSFCSDKIYNLLCFFFFPPCTTQNEKAIPTPVFPCRRYCEEVTEENSTCTRQLIAAQIKYGEQFENKKNQGWGEQFRNCNYSYISSTGVTTSVYRDDVCVDQQHDLALPVDAVKVPKEVDDCATVGKLKAFLQLFKLLSNIFTFFIDSQYSSPCTCNPRLSVSGSVLKRNTYNYGKLNITCV